MPLGTKKLTSDSLQILEEVPLSMKLLRREGPSLEHIQELLNEGTETLILLLLSTEAEYGPETLRGPRFPSGEISGSEESSRIASLSSGDRRPWHHAAGVSADLDGVGSLEKLEVTLRIFAPHSYSNRNGRLTDTSTMLEIGYTRKVVKNVTEEFYLLSTRSRTILVIPNTPFVAK